MPYSFYPDDEWLIDSPAFVLFVTPVLLISINVMEMTLEEIL